jgi:hypothetical protein
MKRAVLILAAAALAAAGPVRAQEKVVFKLMGGIASVNGEDYNAGALGAYRYAIDNSTGLTGGYKTLSSGADFQAEIVNYWGPHFGVGFGGGYFRVANSSGIAGTVATDGTVSIMAGGYDFTSNFAPKFSVLPFFINVHYKFQLGGGLTLEAFAGPVFQIMQFSFTREATSTLDDLAETETFNASDTTLGIQAGLTASWRIWRGVSIVADGFYRSGTVSNIKGNWFLTRTTTSGTETTSSNSYYYWYYDYSQGGLYAQTGFFDADGPGGDGISGARKANINLTGMVILFGLKFSL